YFSQKAWHATHINSRQRLRLYKDLLFPLAEECVKLLGDQAGNALQWKNIKSEYQVLIAERPDRELAETFFNSVIRKSYPKLTVDEDLMFVMEGFDSCKVRETEKLLRTY
ncbi:isocitrate dehydrogenase kinase/phosphatase AceK regulatory subunit, partial [Campylobacter fetus subsp. venerealis]